MSDFPLLYVIAGLFVVIIAEFVFLKYVIDSEKAEKAKLIDQLQATNRALISKNANDYVMTTSMDKVLKEEKSDKPFTEPQEIPEETLTDDQFFDAIGKSLKTPVE